MNNMGFVCEPLSVSIATTSYARIVPINLAKKFVELLNNVKQFNWDTEIEIFPKLMSFWHERLV